MSVNKTIQEWATAFGGSFNTTDAEQVLRTLVEDASLLDTDLSLQLTVKTIADIDSRSEEERTTATASLRQSYAISDDVDTVPPLVPPVVGKDINAERNSRIQAGSLFTLQGGKSVMVTGGATDMRNLQGLAFAAQLRVGQGDYTTETVYRDGNNVNHALTPMEVIELWSTGAAWVSAVYAAAWSMKDGIIPEDYTAAKHWPEVIVS